MSNIRIFRNPLNLKDCLIFKHEGPLIDLLTREFPKGFEGSARVIVNGAELPMKELDREVSRDDLIIILVDPAVELFVQALITALVSAAVSLVVTKLFGPDTNVPGFEQAQQDTIHSIGAKQNGAKIGGVLPVVYGSPVMSPDYASQPWVTYNQIEVAATGTTQVDRPAITDDSQYLNYLLCVGQGEHDIQEVYFGNSPLSELPAADISILDADKSVHNNQLGNVAAAFNATLPAGPRFHENVFTSSEVGGQEFSEPRKSDYFPLGEKPVEMVMLDVVFQRGLYKLNKTNDPVSIAMNMSVNIKGRFSGAIKNFPIQFNNAGNRNATPFRRTITIDIATKFPQVADEPISVELQRVTPEAVSTSEGVFGMDPTWAGLRGSISSNSITELADATPSSPSGSCFFPTNSNGPDIPVKTDDSDMVNPAYLQVYDMDANPGELCLERVVGPFELGDTSPNGITFDGTWKDITAVPPPVIPPTITPGADDPTFFDRLHDMWATSYPKYWNRLDILGRPFNVKNDPSGTSASHGVDFRKESYPGLTGDLDHWIVTADYSDFQSVPRAHYAEGPFAGPNMQAQHQWQVHGPDLGFGDTAKTGTSHNYIQNRDDGRKAPAKEANWMTLVYLITGGDASNPVKAQPTIWANGMQFKTDPNDWHMHTNPALIGVRIGYTQVSIPYSSIDSIRIDWEFPGTDELNINQVFWLPGRFEPTIDIGQDTGAGTASVATLPMVKKNDMVMVLSQLSDFTRTGLFFQQGSTGGTTATTHQINKEAYRYNNQWLERSLYTVNTDGAFTYTNQGGAGSHSQTMVIRFGYVSNEPYTNGVASTFGDVAGIGAVGPTGNTPPTYLAQYPQINQVPSKRTDGKTADNWSPKDLFQADQRVHTYLERPPFTNTQTIGGGSGTQMVPFVCRNPVYMTVYDVNDAMDKFGDDNLTMCGMAGPYNMDTYAFPGRHHLYENGHGQGLSFMSPGHLVKLGLGISPQIMPGHEYLVTFRSPEGYRVAVGQRRKGTINAVNVANNAMYGGSVDKSPFAAVYVVGEGGSQDAPSEGRLLVSSMNELRGETNPGSYSPGAALFLGNDPVRIVDVPPNTEFGFRFKVPDDAKGTMYLSEVQMQMADLEIHEARRYRGQKNPGWDYNFLTAGTLGDRYKTGTMQGVTQWAFYPQLVTKDFPGFRLDSHDTDLLPDGTCDGLAGLAQYGPNRPQEMRRTTLPVAPTGAGVSATAPHPGGGVGNVVPGQGLVMIDDFKAPPHYNWYFMDQVLPWKFDANKNYLITIKAKHGFRYAYVEKDSDGQFNGIAKVVGTGPEIRRDYQLCFATSTDDTKPKDPTAVNFPIGTNLSSPTPGSTDYQRQVHMLGTVRPWEEIGQTVKFAADTTPTVLQLGIGSHDAGFIRNISAGHVFDTKKFGSQEGKVGNSVAEMNRAPGITTRAVRVAAAAGSWVTVPFLIDVDCWVENYHNGIKVSEFSQVGGVINYTPTEYRRGAYVSERILSNTYYSYKQKHYVLEHYQAAAGAPPGTTPPANIVAQRKPASVYGEAHLLAVRMIANDYVASAATQRIKVHVRRKLPSITGAHASVYSNNPATAIYDIMTDKTYGAGRADDSIELGLMNKLHKHWGGEQTPYGFSAVFDGQSTVAEALQTVAGITGAQAIAVGSEITVAPDNIQLVRKQFFNENNIIEGTFNVSWDFDRPGESDGVIVSYNDPSTGNEKTVKVPERCLNPQAMPLFGCNSERQAREYGQLMMNRRVTGRTNLRFDTELESLLCRVGDRIAVSHILPQWGTAYRVLSFSPISGSTKTQITITSDKDIDWGGKTELRAVIRDANGTASLAVQVIKVTENSFTTVEDPSLSNWLRTNDPATFSIGETTRYTKDFVIASIAPSGIVASIEAYAYERGAYADTFSFQSQEIF